MLKRCCMILLLATAIQMWPAEAVATTAEETTESSPIQVYSCVQSEKCVCRVSSNWSAMGDYRMLQKATKEIVQLKDTLASLKAQQLSRRIDEVSSRLTQLEGNVQHQTVGFSILETTELKKNVEILKALLDNLTLSEQATSEQMALSNKVDQLSTTLNSALNKNPYGQNSNLKEELMQIRSGLSKCHENITWTAFAGDSMPLNHRYNDWCSTHEVAGISAATTHKYMPNVVGSWFKDPMPIFESNKTEIFEKLPSRGGLLYRYTNYTNYIQSRNSATIKILAYHGIGHIIYNQSYYYSYSNRLSRYDLRSGNVTNRQVIMTNINYNTQSSGTFVDFNIDETGLWVVYTTAYSNGKLVLRKLNPETLEFIGEPFYTNKLKASTCANFVICGTFYAINDCSSRIPNRNAYYYDTNTATHGQIGFLPVSKFGHIYTLNYNPREQKIFGWDNSHLVTYDVNWKIKGNTP